ncbi:MlaA family lipoprotein [Thiobaca trueperi]|uniref:ABC-type transporter lipoprotein component MlaA n=1 Tax=Thiobaca trueperi TaxID=127458 RepID=A0A4R3MYI5_9GAMM|nr:MlaA family lipoprotein [Thiobaca trueperi]TCT21454.1 ABC-type transporter lipoprotein component MlaA [Thiobaca trueperi]
MIYRIATYFLLLSMTFSGISLAQSNPDNVSPTPAILDGYSHFMFDFNHEVYRFIHEFGAGLAPQTPQAAPSQTDQGGGFGNIAINFVNEPLTLLSGLLIGDWATAWTATQRFGINSTVGVLGWYDTATDWGYPRQELDLGLVLCAYGVDAGPYLVLPFIGPRTARDAFTDVIVTNAILWTSMWMLLDPSSGLLAIAAAEAVEVVAEIAATRQIDSHAGKLEFSDYEAMRADYLAHRLDRCNGLRGIASDSGQD